MARGQDNKNENDLAGIRRKLILRMGVAGLMIVGLLGGLALFDYMGARVENEPEAIRFTEPVPVPKKTITQPVTQAEPEPAPEKKEEKKEPPPPEITAAPIDKSAPKADLPARPETGPKAAVGRPAAGGGRTPSAVSASSPQVSTGFAPSARVSESRSPIGVPSSRGEPTHALPPQPAPARLLSGFALQAGVFSDPRRAEELHARLTLEGIPSTIESRVQVGPFNSREEAEAARIKMKAIGIDAVMLAPSRSGRR